MKKTIYLYKSGELTRKDHSLLFSSQDEDFYIPVEQVDMIVVFCELTLNKRVLALLNEYEIVVLFFSFHGNYIGRYSPKKYSDGKLIVNQVNAYQSAERLKTARTMIDSEIRNVLSFVKYYNKKLNCFDKEITGITECLGEVEYIETVELLMLKEAEVKKIYYSTFDRVIGNKEFHFGARGINPPSNEVNAMLSYGYALLYSCVLSDIDRSPLIPQLSFIHSLSKESDSLHFDIADILKPVFIDRLVMRMINRNQVNPEHFEHRNGGVYLTKEGTKVFIEEYEKLMAKPVLIGKKYYSYRNIVTREVYALANYLSGKNKSYNPFVMRW